MCSYVYDEEKGEPATDTLPGMEFEDLPEDWRCPVCQAGKVSFVKSVMRTFTRTRRALWRTSSSRNWRDGG